VDFEPEIVRVHANPTKIDRPGGKIVPGIVQNAIQNLEIPENSCEEYPVFLFACVRASPRGVAIGNACALCYYLS